MSPLRRSPSPCSSRPSSPRTPPLERFGPVGIEAVLDQLKIKAMKTGFEFNIMVVGQSGLGKSTMVNTLFKSKVWKSAVPSLEVPTPQTLELHSVSHVIEEKGLKLKLTVTDTPGFGDQINNDKCLRPLDIEFLQRLCRTVNVVPVIARADSLTIEEREAFRSRIQQNLKAHCIDVYPQKCFDEDINDSILNGKIREQIPFAVVGADQEHLVNGRCILGRKTKWGIIEVENIAHCEFLLLRDLLIRSHLQDLKDITHNVHYENYRVIRLNESHQLPRGPGWVNLAPPGQLTSPGCLKVRRQAQKDSKDDER
ncbi:septin-12 isoform X2 [Perognathus longimembris pacificus]|uniref:septin-12 isoform X2 n=1 Tax=Perognathus longimembris pacificus TaxID=214514 RepID=UPI002019B761|nr:septin-12 isoform X2 [Perognathus longimembris pacificus]